MSTWILVVYLAVNRGGGPVVIPNFATEADCRTAMSQVMDSWRQRWGDVIHWSVCIEQKGLLR